MTFSAETLSYIELEKYHALVYAAAKIYVEQLTGVEVDASGSDLSRGFFQSFDPKAYLNLELLSEIPEFKIRIIPPEKKENMKAGKRTGGNGMKEPPAVAQSSDIEPWEQLEYRKALNTTKRSDRFEEGNRDNFLYILGNRCYRKGIREQAACTLILHDFSREDMDVLAPVRNAYTSKTEASEKVKEEKKLLISQVMEFLEAHYVIRRNTVLDRLEFMPCGKFGETDKAYRPMRGKDYNSIFVELQMAGIVCFQNFLKAVIDSDYWQTPFILTTGNFGQRASVDGW